MFFHIFIWFLSLYNAIYRKYIKPWYDSIYGECITEIVQYDLTNLKKKVLYRQGFWELFFAYIGIKKSMLCDRFEIEENPYCNNYYIYSIICSDSSKYLTHYPFNIENKKPSKGKVRFISATLLNTDITFFMNERSGSFTAKEEIDVYEIAIVCILNGVVNLKNVKQNDNFTINAILDDEDLTHKQYDRSIIVQNEIRIINDEKLITHGSKFANEQDSSIESKDEIKGFEFSEFSEDDFLQLAEV